MIALLSLELVALLVVAVLAGMHVSGSAALNPALRSLDAPTYVPVKHALDRAFPTIARPLLLGGIVLTGGLVAVSLGTSHPAAAALGGGAFVGLAVTLAAVVRGDLPINRQMASWSASAPPPEWRAVQASWERFFAIRTVASTAALGCLAVAAMLPR